MLALRSLKTIGSFLPRLRSREAAAWLGRGLVNLVYPPVCAFCGVDLPPDSRLRQCNECDQKVGPVGRVACPRCGEALRPEGTPGEDCPKCRGKRFHFNAVVALGEYEGTLRDAVLKSKRAGCETLPLALGNLLAERRSEGLAAINPDVVVPIPMHWWRRLGRGVNSPDLVAECLGRQLGRPVARLLVRRRYTVPQRDLLPRQRVRNIRGAFRVRQIGRRNWRGSHVLLVDDILTTGATCNEAARILRQAGVAAVSVAVIARAPGP